MFSAPIASFITFRTYGTWIPGDRRWSTRHSPDERGVIHQPPSNPLRKSVRATQAREAVVLTAAQRGVVREAIEEACAYRGWTLHAVNVRTNHVHAVVTSDTDHETVMRMLKTRATKLLRERGLHDSDESPWARHGSTRHLFKPEDVTHAVWYTNEAQDGERYEQ